jgi:hypothetical protein
LFLVGPRLNRGGFGISCLGDRLFRRRLRFLRLGLRDCRPWLTCNDWGVTGGGCTGSTTGMPTGAMTLPLPALLPDLDLGDFLFLEEAVM